MKIWFLITVVLYDVLGQILYKKIPDNTKHFHEIKEVKAGLFNECNDKRYVAADVGPCIDSIITKGKHIPAEYGDALEDRQKHRRRRVAKHWLKWPKNPDGMVYVPYKFSTTNSNVTRGFVQGAEYIANHSCVRLVLKTDVDINFIDVIDDEGCYSFIGMQGGSQEMSLQAYTRCTETGVVIHEILHALGFYHEMARIDRDKYIEVHLDNILISETRQFDTHLYANGSVYGEEYDIQSIMHYGNYAFAVNKDLPTLTSKRNAVEELGQRDGMSEKDKRQLNKMYKCKDFITIV